MRTHYKPRKISQITSSDSKVALVGTVSQVNENSFVVDDGTGKAEISSDIKVEENKIVRVFCMASGGKLKADIVQNLENLDLNLFKTVEELYSKAGV